jgi:flagellar motor switch protein FliM
MESILDQKEVDALLAAVDEGEIDLSTDKGPEETLAPESVAPYDFKRPERVSKEQMRSLENLHEVFARNMGAMLSAYQRTLVDCKLVAIEQMTYGEFIMSLPNPTCFVLLSAPPLEGELILEINPSIIFPILDRILGGGRERSAALDRPLTEIEQRLTKKIIEQTLDQLKNVWARIEQIDFRLEEIESNPQLRQIVPPNEVVVLISFEITMGEASGMLNLCIPFTVIEPLMPRFAIQNIYNFKRRKPEVEDISAISDGLADARLEAVAYLAETRLTVEALAGLKIGDVLQTGKPAEESILLMVEGKPKFRGKGCTFRNKKAVQITDRATHHDHI